MLSVLVHAARLAFLLKNLTSVFAISLAKLTGFLPSTDNNWAVFTLLLRDLTLHQTFGELCCQIATSALTTVAQAIFTRPLA